VEGTPLPGVRPAGLDWSWSTHAVCVLEPDGTICERFTVAHTADGLRTLTRRLERLGVTTIAIERGDGIVPAALLEAGIAVVVIPPRQVRALRLRYGSSGNKDDAFDAYVLADVLRTDAHRLRPITPDTAATDALRALCRTRKDLIKHRLAVANQLRANLLIAFPGALGLFAQLDSPISLAFLERCPAWPQAGRLTERRLQAWLVSVGYCGRQTPAQLLDHLTKAPPGRHDEARALITRELVATLRHLRDRIDLLDERIAEAITLHPDGAIFRSLPRAGTNRAALLLSEIGDCRARYPDDETLAAAAGVAPSTRASGKTRHVRFRHGCDLKLRDALVDFAADSRHASPWAAAIYDRARTRGCRHPHAVRILARAWTRVIWRCWNDHQPYDPTRHRSAQLTQGLT